MEYWDFNWADMGYYDLPASIEKVLAISGAEKLSIVGHSQGTSQTWYSMAHKQDFLAERVHRYVALSTCIFATGYNEIDDYEETVSLFLTLRNLGYASIFGTDDSSA